MTPREQEARRLYQATGNQSTVARLMGISRERVRQLLNRTPKAEGRRRRQWATEEFRPKPWPREEGKPMTLREFIRQNRAQLDECIARALNRPTNPYPNDEERRLWVLNDEGLYRWAKSEGCRI